MAVFNSFTFDSINSLNYGIYISGEGVYNAPERAVEMVSIPGRNGALAMDEGRFENTEIHYPAGTFGTDQSDFKSKVTEFRNILCSRYSYARLTDDYHPDEFRMALYKSGLDVEPVQHNKAGEFDIIFECKPQRFLVSGETPQSASDWSDVETETGGIVEIENDGMLAIKDLTADIEPIQSGSGDPSPSNVRPISGHTDVVVVRANENLAGDDGHQWNINSSGKIESNNQYDATVFKVVSGQKYTITFDGSGDYRAYAFFEYYPKVGDTCYGSRSGVSTSSVTVTAPIDGWCVARPTIGEVVTKVNKGETALTTAEDTDIYTIDLDGTRYGGTLDVTTGVLTVTHAIVDMGDLTWNRTTSYANPLFYTSITAKGTETDGTLSSAFHTLERAVASASNFSSYSEDGDVASSNGNTQVYVRWDAITDKTTFTTNVTGQKLVYPLATPTTVNLTAQEIELLQGANNVWASTGDVTVEYGVPPFTNPTLFTSNPLIKVTGIGTLTVGDTSIVITGTASQVIYIDCESKEIYKINGGVITPAGSLVSFSTPDFPQLKPGINKVVKGTGITDVEITPRWWRI